MTCNTRVEHFIFDPAENQISKSEPTKDDIKWVEMASAVQMLLTLVRCCKMCRHGLPQFANHVLDADNDSRPLLVRCCTVKLLAPCRDCVLGVIACTAVKPYPIMREIGSSRLAATQSVTRLISKAEAVHSADSRITNQNLRDVIRAYATMTDTQLATFFSAMKTQPAPFTTDCRRTQACITWTSESCCWVRFDLGTCRF